MPDYLSAAYLNRLYDSVLRNDVVSYTEALTVLRGDPVPDCRRLTQQFDDALRAVQAEMARRRAEVNAALVSDAAADSHMPERTCAGC